MNKVGYKINATRCFKENKLCAYCDKKEVCEALAKENPCFYILNRK